jgi:predicted aldo/keto reductase-like oxidoreductase
MLLHCTTRPDWPDQRRSVIDALQEAKTARKIRAIGVSCHSLDALRVASGEECIDVNLVRVNPQGRITDREKGAPRDQPGAIEPVMAEIRKMKARGNGVIGMKIIGEGSFRDPVDRERSIRFAMSHKEIDAVTIGFVNPAEMDEVIQRMNRALAEA